MKILFANEYVYPNVGSGAEFSMQELAFALEEFKQEIIFFGPNISTKKIKDYRGIKVIKFPFFKKTKPYSVLSPIWFNNPLFWIYSMFYFVCYCIKEKIQLIHVHGKYLLPGSIIAGKLLGIPVVITVRDYKFLCPLGICLTEKGKTCNWKYYLNREAVFYFKKYHNLSGKPIIPYLKIIVSKLFQKINFLFLSKSDLIICVSNGLKVVYQKSGIKLKKMTTIYNLHPVIKMTSSLNSKIVLSIGKISYGKGTDLLVKSFQMVKKKYKSIKLLLIGRKSASFDINLSDIPGVDYLGQLEHQKVIEYYKKAAVFVLVSRWPEPLSRSTLEALSFGLPLIVSKKGGNREVVVDGKSGYLVKLDPKDISAKIIYLLKNKKKRLQMSRRSLDLLETRFNRKKIVKQHLEAYRNLIK